MEKKFIIMIALMLSATAGLIYEITTTNLLFFYFIESSYSMATVISVFLLGLGIGSFGIYKYKKKIKNKRKLFGILQVLIGIYAIITLINLDKFLLPLSTHGLFFSSFLILLIPTICLGAIFPLAGHIISKNKNEVGLIYSVDLIGAVIGSLIAGFYLIPLLGNKGTILCAVILNFGSATLVFKNKKRKFLGILGILLTLLFLISTQIDITTHNSPEEITASVIAENHQEKSYPPGGIILPEGLPEEFAIFEKPSAYGEIRASKKTLFINGREQCSLDYMETTGERKVVTKSLEPLNSEDLNVLNIGLGCGLSLEEILKNVDNQVDIVEINPVVVEANKFMTDVLNNEKVNLIVQEGFDYLRKTDKIYDSIIIDIENPNVVHASNIYTKESFKILEEKLAKDGTFGLWVCPCGNNEYYDVIYYTLLESFNYVYKITGEIFVSSNTELDYPRYNPSTKKQVNTLDKKILSKIYFDNCKWWVDDSNMINN